MKVGDLVKHKHIHEYGIGLLAEVCKAQLEINGRTHHYQVRWCRKPDSRIQYFHDRGELEVISESR